MSQPLVLKIPIRNRAGEIVGEKEVVSYAGLLAKAHDEGLQQIETILVQLPSADNGGTAVVRAVVSGKQGSFSGLGDANTANVNPGVARHLIRIAETRAKARALRDYVNVGMVSLEELGGDEDGVDDVAPASAVVPAAVKQQAPSHTRAGTDGRASDAQRRMLWRQALKMGHQGEAAGAFLRARSGVERVELMSKQAASNLIDELERELRHAEGSDHAAE